MSYGTPDDVAAKARIWSTDGHWYDVDVYAGIRETNPSLTAVTNWLEEVSDQMNLALQANWFNVPVTVADSPIAYKAIKGYVTSLVADMCRKANGEQVEIPPMGKIMKDMTAWVEANADGFLKNGLTQTQETSVKKQATIRVIGTLK